MDANQCIIANGEYAKNESCIMRFSFFLGVYCETPGRGQSLILTNSHFETMTPSPGLITAYMAEEAYRQ